MRPARMASVLAALFVLLAGPLAALVLVAAPSGAAGTFTADILTDAVNDATCLPGSCTLREAINAASAAGGGTVVLAATGTYSLTNAAGPLDYAGGGTLSITGNGNTVSQTLAGQGVISRSGFTTAMTIDGLTVEGGGGPGIFSSGNVILTNSTVTGNTTNALIGVDVNYTVTNSTVSGSSNNDIANIGNVTLINSTVTGAQNNDVANIGTVTLLNSTVSNASTRGIANIGDDTLTNSTVTGSHQQGIANVGNDTLTNSIVTGNLSGTINSGNLTLVYADVTNNSASNVFVTPGRTFTAFGSVVLTTAGPACQGPGTFTSNGFNFGDGTCHFNQSTDHNTGGNPGLGALANNGGPTQTLLPQAGSPLLDAIPVASCQADGASRVTTDQRGVTRPQGSGCDIGAVEVAVPTAVITAAFTG